MSFLLATCRRSKRNDDVQPPLSGYAKWTHRLQKELVQEKEGMHHIIKIPIDDELRLGEYMALDTADPKEEVLPETIEERKMRQLDAISHWIRVSGQNAA